MTSVMDIPDELENSLEQLVVSNTVAGILFTTEVVIIYMNLFRFYFALSLAISLVGLRTSKNSVNQDLVILDNTLRLSQRLVKAQGVIHPFNVSIFFADVWVELEITTNKELWFYWFWKGLVQITSIFIDQRCSTFLIGYKIWSSQRYLKPYTEHTQLLPSSCSVLDFINNDIGRILLIILESGSLYVIVWLLAIFADARVLNENAETSENALLPHLAGIEEDDNSYAYGSASDSSLFPDSPICENVFNALIEVGRQSFPVPSAHQVGTFIASVRPEGSNAEPEGRHEPEVLGFVEYAAFGFGCNGTIPTASVKNRGCTVCLMGCTLVLVFTLSDFISNSYFVVNDVQIFLPLSHLDVDSSGFLGVYGTLDASATLNQADTEDGNPQVDCSLDGIDIGSDEVANFLSFPAVGQGPVNNLLFCVIQGSSAVNGKDSKFQPGEHELQINVTNPNGTMGWFFDYITFEGMPGFLPTNGQVLQAGKPEVVSNVTDYSMLNFPPSQGWNFDTNDLSTFSGNHSNVTLTFNGTSVSMFAGLFGLNDDPYANGFYQVDSLDPVGFQVPILSSDFSNQLIWTADELDIGAHTVLVSFNVSPHSDLLLGHFYVNAGNIDSETTSTVATPTQSLSPTGISATGSQASKKHLGVGATVGIVLGICILMLLLIGSVILWRRSKRRSKALNQFASAPFSYQDNPDATDYQPVAHNRYQSTFKSSRKHEPDNIVSSVPPAADSSTDRPQPGNTLVMKLQQRLVVMEGQLQVQHQESQLDQNRIPGPLVHTDSGLRLTEGSGYNTQDEIPPGYTEQ
ncbi:hypothetical protein K435DRAFT_792000 [Dendrothele bispora CBS 962.96]|uniref:Uncharacterized protein n=1 Tax=Dendrothele bispora (strain CBS 962.96) TaxID=1314807 RepID=A0A4S8MK08_DENBC|nr:hypothetical protein K435DRAFT_792000 [Dendrothele bispora CBS 962.96]